MQGPVKLVEQRCPSCNAPLQVDPNLTVVTCRYCNNSISIQRAKAPQTRVSQFGAPGHVPSTVLYIPSGAVGATVATSLIPVLIPVAIMLVVGVGAGVSAFGRRFVSLPTQCRPNETLILSGKNYDGDKPVVEASVNCKLTLKDSTLKSSDVIVKGGVNLELKIINSKLTSKTTVLDLATTNSKVWISDKSELHGGEVGVKGEGNAEIEVRNSTVTGGQAAIDLGSNAKVSLVDATLKGKEHGLKTTTNGKVTAKSSTITSDEVGVQLAGSNGSIDARGLTVSAGDAALLVEHNGDLKLADKSALTSSRGDAVATKGSNVKLLLEDSKLVAKDTALRLGTNADVRLRKGASVQGEKEGLHADHNLKLSVEGATLTSSGPAVTGTSNAEVRVLAGSTVKGAPAFAFPSKPSRFDVAEGTVTGESQLESRASASAASPSAGMRAAIAATGAQMKACKDPGHGTVVARFVVLPAGRVATVSVSGSASRAAQECVAAKLRATTFPAGNGITNVNTSYTL
ncbi:MAG: hypothetical protein IPF92_28475 [Myxococcales bacterium]|nr:hypothetical protein [Myxococcales bacterium]